MVDETSPAEPLRETGQILRETEELVLASGGVVARLAGLYGPGRCVPLQKLLDGRATIEECGTRQMNMLHHLDAAAALQFLAETESGGLFNVVDNQPVARDRVVSIRLPAFEQAAPSGWSPNFEPKTRLDEQKSQ